MTINSRTKGASAEREFSNAIYEWAGIRLVRNLEQSRSGGFDLQVHDDELGAVADAYRGLAIECKRYGKVTPGLIKTWWAQAMKQAEPKQLIPILAFRADRGQWQVIAPLYLINAAMSKNLGLESTAVLSVSGFCGVVSEVQ
ncbi:MAG: hypothetical protein QX196_07280 [Methylococcaceae bacterium]